jgi:hypothetical protein
MTAESGGDALLEAPDEAYADDVYRRPIVGQAVYLASC